MRPEEPPPAEAAALLDRLLEIVREQWTIHFLVVVPAQIAMELLHDRYVELLGDDDPLAPYRLLEGLPNESTTADSELLEPVKAAAPLKETHTYFIDYPALLATREVLLAFGRRLAAEGALADPDDVWMLRVDELREAVLEWRTLHDLVAARREELARGRREGPRPFLGEPPVEQERHIVLEKVYGPGREGAAEAVR